MKILGSVLIFLLLPLCIAGQNEASFWYFGQNAGVRFDSEAGTVIGITDGRIDTLEGCTSISDTDGNLLFYSDGSTVWNRNHQTMFNGFGLKGDDSSTSSGLIVPKPQDPDFYYLFTVDEPHHFNSSNFPADTANDGVNDGLTYSRINILDDNGLGAVANDEKNIPLVTYDTANPLEVDFKCSEKITAVRADDCSSIWVITHFTEHFYAFKIDENGVNPNPVISTAGPNIPVEGYRRNALGYLKASPDGTKLISANFGEATIAGGDAGGSIYLFDFDNDTGIVSNALELYSVQNNNSPYGVEFSAENRKAYASIGLGPEGNGASQVVQWDLENADIPGSIQIVHQSNTISAGALQLGIDRRIYRAQFSFDGNFTTARYLGVITNPETTGMAANYQEQGVLVDVNNFNQNTSRIGLPPFIQSLFNSQTDIIRNGESTTELKLCESDSYILQADDITGADYVWSFNGVELPETTSQLFVDTPGFYEVFIEPNNGDCPIEGSAVVGVFDIPVANPVADIIACDGNANDGFFEFDLTQKNSEVLLNQDASQFEVLYFESAVDANNKVNEISFPYINSTNPQTIVARIENRDNPNCFDTTAFQIEVFDTPQIIQLNDIEFCDNQGDSRDGFASIDLDELKPLIRGAQDELQTRISFHSSQEDADNNDNPLNLDYTNSTAFFEQIYVRIENTFNTSCYSTENFDLIINDAPIANDISIVQCDEDGIPEGFTLFNVNSAIAEITDNQTDVSVDFYLSQADAENEQNAVNGDAFSNFFNPQTLFSRVTNTSTGCVSFGEVSLEVSTTGSNDASLEVCDTDGIEDGFTSFDLNATNAIVLAGAPAGLQLQYFESYEDALLETNALGNSFTNTVPFNQTIYARVENANACYGISQIELTVLELPMIETEFETRYCLNSFPETLTLDGGVIGSDPNSFSYQWSTGEDTSSINVSAPGTYTVTVLNAAGCSKQRTITVLPSNIATIDEIQVQDGSQNNSITVLVSGEGDYEFALDNGNGPYQDSNTFTNVPPGLYTVFVRDKNDCGTVDELVSVIGFPRFFTPNNDTRNDYWQVSGVSEQFQADTSIFIFDRYGKLLKELDPLSPGWDGTYNGIDMPTSDYWFRVKLQDGREFNGHFTLKR